jgi:hypothetical protein
VSGARLAARALALLGPAAGPIAVVAPRARRLARAVARTTHVAADGDAPAAALVVLLGVKVAPSDRQETLRATQRRLPTGAPLVLVDHNQPRAVWRRALAVVPLLVAGLGPSRARYPAARELAALGFVVERLQLACGERVQLVVARRLSDPE